MTTKIFTGVIAILVGIFACLQIAHADEEKEKTTSTVVTEWVLEYPVTVTTQELVTASHEATEIRIHNVSRGETLSQIAKTYLGTMDLYPQIAQQNQISNPDLIFPGQALQIEVMVWKEAIYVTKTHVEMRQERISVVLPVTVEETSEPANRSEGPVGLPTSREDGKIQLRKLIEKLIRLPFEDSASENLAAACLPEPTVCDPSLTSQDEISLEEMFATPAPIVELSDDVVPIETVDYPVESFIWPVLGPLSDYFGVCNLVLRRSCHTGIDIDLFRYSSTNIHAEIMAAKSGVVVVSGCSSQDGYGCRIEIDHGDAVTSLYAHLSLMNVAVGSQVKQGEIIGLSGLTGTTTGEHLHFEIKVDSVPQNPLQFLP